MILKSHSGFENHFMGLSKSRSPYFRECQPSSHFAYICVGKGVAPEGTSEAARTHVWSESLSWLCLQAGERASSQQAAARVLSWLPLRRNPQMCPVSTHSSHQHVVQTETVPVRNACASNSSSVTWLLCLKVSTLQGGALEPHSN